MKESTDENWQPERLKQQEKATDVCQSMSNSSGEIRKFIVLKLNFEANDYYELVNWLEFPRLEPPITFKLSDNDIEEAIRSGSMPDLEKYPCHTQAVERHPAVEQAREARQSCY